mmetsp:Transcript_43372/g.114210  ORF Transcript_43372/g.114210 Transcript_43372/m.114210 type:complete len:763 (-) Transcript_43372:125-2413(-)
MGQVASNIAWATETGRAATLQEPADVETLLSGCPRELAETLRETGQWDALRCRPWLSASAFRGLQRSLQRCQLPKLTERYREALSSDDCTYSLPPVVPWEVVEVDHFISAGQVFRREDASHDKICRLRRIGLQVLRRGKVGMVLLAGGANLRLGLGEPPVGCSKKVLQLCSGKSIVQLICERLRRLAALCQGPEPLDDPANAQKPTLPRLSVPVFVMTSRLTHHAVVEHFESNQYFGLLSRDVFFFEQPVLPVLADNGCLLPQSLGGEFAHAPGGTGELFAALANSSALEQMRDRGVECVHVIGTENILARACDPLFIGFCRELDIDCACKVTKPLVPDEKLELFCIRQSPVSSHYADVEEAACGLSPSEMPEHGLQPDSRAEGLGYVGSINSFFFTVSYIDEVVGRPVRPHRLSRVVPYLEFHICDKDGDRENASGASASETSSPVVSPKKGNTPSNVALGSWPAESASIDLPCQRALLTAAADVRARCCTVLGDRTEACRCEVHLDGNGPRAVVHVRSARSGYLTSNKSINMQDIGASERSGAQLGCNLVVPSKENAVVLETSILDYFAYTDRAVAFEVNRTREFAPVREMCGLHSPNKARQSLSVLHCSWLLAGGWTLLDSSEPGACLEISPLLSYEGEGLRLAEQQAGSTLQLPQHLPGLEELRAELGMEANVPTEEVGDGLDTRPYYLQEYPQRWKVRDSHAPQFRLAPSSNANPGGVGGPSGKGVPFAEPTSPTSRGQGVTKLGSETSASLRTSKP